MKIFTLSVILLALGTICRAQEFTYNQGAATTKNYYEEIPYQDIDGKIFINVEISGKKHLFLVDTGSPNMISKELATELNLKSIHKDVIADVSGQIDSITTVLLPEVKVGNTVFGGIPTLVSTPYWYKCQGAEGVIGSNLLRNAIICFDGKKHQIIITDQLSKLPFLSKKNSGQLMTNRDQQSTPVMKFLLGSKVNLEIEFDSGDSDFLRLTEDITNQLNKYKVFSILSKGYGSDSFGASGMSKNADKYLIKVPLLTIGNTRFTNAITATIQQGIPGVGAKLLSYANVTLDYMHGRYYLNADSAAYDLNAKQWPFSTTILNNKIVVGVVYDKGTNLVKLGEQITGIDGVDYPEVTFCDWINKKSMLKGKDTAIFSIKDEQGNIKKIQVSKQ